MTELLRRFWKSKPIDPDLQPPPRTALLILALAAFPGFVFGGVMLVRTAVLAVTAEPDPVMRIAPLREKATEALARNDPETAETLCRQALALDIADAATHRLLSTALSALGEAEAAVIHAREAVKLEPKDPDCQARLGEACYSLLRRQLEELAAAPVPARPDLRGRTQNAMNEAEQVLLSLCASPRHTKSALRRLGHVFYLHGTCLALAEAERRAALLQATGYYKQAHAQAPSQYEEAFQIGVCNYRLGRSALAREWLARAAALREDAPAAHYYLALLAVRAGESGAARDHFAAVGRAAETLEGDERRRWQERLARAERASRPAASASGSLSLISR